MPSDSARYAYLVGRLRNKQITMSEATELFEMQQATLASALTASGRMPPPPPPPTDYSGTAPSTPAPSTAGTPAPPDDLFWMGMLAVGAGAGVLAAILRRGQAGNAPAPARAPRSP